jgi:hypothetical protein
MYQALSEGRRKIMSSYTDGERRTICVGNVLPPSLKEKFVTNILGLAATIYRGHPSVSSSPSDFDDLCNRYIFRLSLNVHIWMMEWIIDGCADGSNVERIRNDLIDLNVATYATYFDGLMTGDAKLFRIHAVARYLLNGIRGKKQP